MHIPSLIKYKREGCEARMTKEQMAKRLIEGHKQCDKQSVNWRILSSSFYFMVLLLQSQAHWEDSKKEDSHFKTT